MAPHYHSPLTVFTCTRTQTVSEIAFRWVIDNRAALIKEANENEVELIEVAEDEEAAPAASAAAAAASSSSASSAAAATGSKRRRM